MIPGEGTGIGPVDGAVVWAVALTASATALGMLWRLLRAVHAIAERIETFWDDWSGVPARSGVPGRQGVMKRLKSAEDRLAALERGQRAH